MTLLKEIQKDAVDPNVDITTLLRKCKILAARLENEAFKSWVEKELNGYKTKRELPEYRILHVQSHGHFLGPLGRELRNAPIPPSCLPEEYREIATTAYLMEGIGTYASLVKDKDKKSSMLQSAWPADLVALVQDKIYQDMNCLSAWRQIGYSSVVGLIDTVRNRVLSFVLEIESEAPSAGESAPSETPIPEELVTQIFQTYIMGDVSNLSTGGSNITQITCNIIKNDLGSLEQYLESLHIHNDDIKDLVKAIKEDPVPTDSRSLGHNVSDWIGKMVSKATSGVWQVSTQVAANLLTKALLKYYGLE